MGTWGVGEDVETKATIASRIKSLEIELAELERQLESADSAHKEALQKWIARLHQTLRRLGRHTLH